MFRDRSLTSVLFLWAWQTKVRSLRCCFLVCLLCVCVCVCNMSTHCPPSSLYSGLRWGREHELCDGGGDPRIITWRPADRQRAPLIPASSSSPFIFTFNRWRHDSRTFSYYVTGPAVREAWLHADQTNCLMIKISGGQWAPGFYCEKKDKALEYTWVASGCSHL